MSSRFPRTSVKDLLARRPANTVAIGFSGVVLLMLVLMLLIHDRVDVVHDLLEEIVTEHNSHSGLTFRMQNAARGRALILHRMVLSGDPFEGDAAMDRFYELGADFGRARHAFLAEKLGPEEAAVLDRLGVAVNETMVAQEQVIEHVRAGQIEQARHALLSEVGPRQERVYDTLNEMIRLQQQEVGSAASLARNSQNQTHILLIGGGAATAVLSILIAVYAYRRINLLLQGIRESAEHLEATVVERTAELAEREEVMRQMTGVAHDAVIMTDDGDRITFWNAAAQSMFGYSAQEAIGQKLHDLVMPDRLRERFEAGFARFHSSGSGELIGKTRELTARRRDGDEFPVEIALSAAKIKGRWHAIGLARDITDRKQSEEALQLLATTDQLTGIANRRKFDETLALEMNRALRYDIPLTLVMFDIDHFKRVNDVYGHPVGDQILIALTHLVSERVRANDCFARWGGEEFVILAIHCDTNCTQQFVEQLRTLVESHAFVGPGRITCSFGFSTLRRDDTISTLVARVDEALYRAKGAGRNCVVAL